MIGFPASGLRGVLVRHGCRGAVRAFTLAAVVVSGLALLAIPEPVAAQVQQVYLRTGNPFGGTPTEGAPGAPSNVDIRFRRGPGFTIGIDQVLRAYALATFENGTERVISFFFDHPNDRTGGSIFPIESGSSGGNFISKATENVTITVLSPAEARARSLSPGNYVKGTLERGSSITFSVSNNADDPVLMNPIGDREATIGSEFSYMVPSNTFAARQGGSISSTSATLADGKDLPTWLGYASNTSTFSGTVPGFQTDNMDVVVVATAGNGRTAHAYFTISFAADPNNTAPVAANDAASGTEDDTTITGNVIDGDPDDSDAGQDMDADDGDTLSVIWVNTGASFSKTGATMIPTDGSASIDSAETNGGSLEMGSDGAFTFTVGSRHQGLPAMMSNTEVFSYQLSDGRGGMDEATLTITLTAINSAPVEANAISDVTIDEDAAWAFTFPAADETNNVFSNPDGHALTYSSMQVVSGTQQALPAWLVQGSTGRTFRGTPRNADVGTITIRVTATDTGGLTGFTDFDVTVRNINDAPTVVGDGIGDHIGQGWRVLRLSNSVP